MLKWHVIVYTDVFGLRPKPTRIENPEDIEKAQKKKNYNERYELCFYDRKNMAYPYLLDHHNTSGSNSSQWFGFSAFVCSYARCVLAEAIIAGGMTLFILTRIRSY